MKNMKSNNSPLESKEQEIVIQWKNLNLKRYPALDMLHASMNGVRVSAGIRAKMKKQGLVAGFPDLMLDVARRGYHGLRIELKRVKGGVVSKDQARVLARMNEEGSLAKVCKGHAEAIELIEWYLGIYG